MKSLIRLGSTKFKLLMFLNRSRTICGWTVLSLMQIPSSSVTGHYTTQRQLKTLQLNFRQIHVTTTECTERSLQASLSEIPYIDSYSTIMFVNWRKFHSSLSLSVKTILVCRYNDVTLTDLKLHGNGNTDCENSDNTSCIIISRSGLENFVYINHISVSYTHLTLPTIYSV